MQTQPQQQKDDYVDIQLGRYEFFFKKRYEILYNINDFLIALWFFVGSIFFFSDSLTFIGTWLFVIGSAQLFIRPIIRIVHKVHLKRVIKRKSEETL